MEKKPARKVYLDFQASTPVDSRVLKAMLPYFSDQYANPHSTEHAFGMEAERAVDSARHEVADLLGCEPKEIIFTSGATESNNLALLGLVHEKSAHVITSEIEHKSILAVMDELKHRSVKVTMLPVSSDGRVDPEAVAKAIRKHTVVSIMAANNEIGVVQPIQEIAEVCAEKEVAFHTDAAQALGKIPFKMTQYGLGSASISSHKLYGPKGIGALYVDHRVMKQLRPLFFGGGQEQGFRPGTVPTPLAVGFGRAAVLAGTEMETDAEKSTALRDQLLNLLLAKIPDLTVNGSMEHRLPGNLNICIPHIEAEDLLNMLPDVALSTGSACASRTQTPSHVLMALGLSYEQANSSVRISIGRTTTPDEITYAAARIVESVVTLRN